MRFVYQSILASSLVAVFTGGHTLLQARHDVITQEKKEEKKEEKNPLHATWVRESEGFTISMKFEKDKLTLDVKIEQNSLSIVSTTKQDGEKITAEITEVSTKGNFPVIPEKGSKLSFKAKVDNAKITISDFEAPHAEGGKAVIEGEYKKKSD